MKAFVDRWNDSVHHYYTHVGIRKLPELYWRCFAYEVLRWPDGIKPSNFKAVQ